MAAYPEQPMKIFVCGLIVSFLSIILAALVSIPAIAETPAINRKIALFPGESKTIEIPWEQNVNVSRRGVIHLKHLGEKKWQLTALKTGVVMILGDTKKSSDPIIIEVLPRQLKSHKKSLPTEPKETLASINLDIRPEEIQVLVRGYVTLDEDALSTRSGFSTNASLSLSTSPVTTSRVLAANFSPQTISSLSNTIASPILSVVTGSEATAHTGGEFPSHVSTEHGRAAIKEGWKEYGFRLKITPERGIGDSITLTYDMTLKTITSSGNSPKLSSNELSGTVLMTRGILAQAGTINLSGTGTDSSGPADGIPIIGPFFSESKKDRANKKLTLWLEYEVPELMQNAVK